VSSWSPRRSNVSGGPTCRCVGHTNRRGYDLLMFHALSQFTEHDSKIRPMTAMALDADKWRVLS